MRKACLHFALIGVAAFTAHAQYAKTIRVEIAPPTSLPALANPASASQIRKYLSHSGELEAYRLRWIAAVDQNRSLGAPYWPESFWTNIKSSMQSADLFPMYITWYQHTVSAELMQQVLNAYNAKGNALFQDSPASIALSQTQLKARAEMDKLTLANTLTVIQQVYAVYKPQIKAARAAYLTAHPDYVDR